MDGKEGCPFSEKVELGRLEVMTPEVRLECSGDVSNSRYRQTMLWRDGTERSSFLLSPSAL